MNARGKLAPSQLLTIPEFLGFTATRPKGERWELIEGIAIMNPSPVDWHQVIVSNLVTLLMNHKLQTDAAWLPLLGVGTRTPMSPNSLPQPDAFVMEGPTTGSHVTDDALVVIEVLSRSNRKADQVWRRKAYASIPNCRHYVTVSLKRQEIVVYDHDTQWKGRTIAGIEPLTLPAIGVTLALADIYRFTPIQAG